MATERLTGQKTIAAYAERSWKTIEELIQEGFPAAKIGGRWEAFKDQIDLWYRERIIREGDQKKEDMLP